MIFPVENFVVLGECIHATGPALAGSTFLSVATGISLAELKRRLPKSQTVNGLIYIHFLPLLIPPVLLVAVLHLALEAGHHNDLAQSTILLAAFGYLFHAGITLALVSWIFHWDERVNTFRRLILNLPKRRSIWFGLFLAKIAPVVSFCLAATMILEESMVTAPFFTTRQTLVSVVIYRSHLTSGDTLSNLTLIMVVLGSFAVILLFSYWFPILIGRRLLTSAAVAHRQDCRQRIDNVRPNLSYEFVAFVLPVCSSALICVSSTLALTQLIWQGRGASLLESATLLSTLLSTSIRLGVLSFFVIVFTTIIGFHSGRIERKAFDPFAPLALLPPALIGTVGLALTRGPASETWILAVCLGGYAYLVMTLVLNPASLRKERQLFRNALKCRLNWGQLSLVVLASRVGGSLPVALLGLYMLWIEDGIQVTIGGHSDNLAYAVRGLRNGLQTHIYKGALITFAVWFVLAALCFFFKELRYRFISNSLQKRFAAAIVTVWIALSVSHTQPVWAQKSTRSRSSAVCILNAKETDAVKGNVLALPKCPSIVIPWLEVRTGALHVQLQPSTTSIRINNLVFESERPTVYIEGSGPSDEVDLTMDSVRTAPNATSSELRLKDIRLGRFAVTGSSGKHSSAVEPGETSITFQPTATVQDFHLHSLTASQVDIILPKNSMSSVHIDALKGRSIYIHGDESDSQADDHDPTANGRHSATFANGRPSRTTLQELTLTDVSLAADTAEPARLALKGITLIDSQVNIGASGSIQLRFEDLQIPSGSVSTFEANGLSTDSHLSVNGEDLGLDGTLKIHASDSLPLDSFLLDSVQPTRSTADGRLEVTVPGFGRIDLSDLAVSHLSLCGAIRQSDLDFSVRHVSITDDVSVPEQIVTSPWKAKFGTERSSFLRTLQERGFYCDLHHTPIALDALYFRKKLELSTVHPIVSVLIEHLTGFGIRLFEAVETFCLLIGLHFLLRLLIITMPLTKAQLHGGFIRETLLLSLAGTFTMREHGEPTPTTAALLETVRLCFGWIIFVQITLCSIYLGQTTLQ